MGRKSFLILLKKNKENVADGIILLSIFIFLLTYFTPDLILSNTLISAGDTVGHYYGTYYMNKYLIPNLKLIGWSQDWFLGYPAFQFYFPLTFFLSGLLGYLIPLPVAFKIITVLGTFLLPVFTYFSFRLMRAQFPIPAIASSITLIFLFLERISPDQIYSMWGGNIPSTLAGEFSYSLSLSLGILFFGFLYRSVKEKKFLIISSIIFTLVILSHVIVAFFFTIASVFYLLEKNFIKNLKTLFKVYFLSFLLSGFWFFPMIIKVEYTVPHIWGFPPTTKELINMLIPQPLQIFYLISAISIFIAFLKKDKITILFGFSAILALAFFLVTPTLNKFGKGWEQFQLVKFLPLMYLSILLTIPSLIRYLPKISKQFIIPFIILALVIIWVNKHVTYIPYWIKWNYEGYEAKPLFLDYKEANEFLSKHKIGRVAFEYDPQKYESGLGSSRATETIPVFSGRPITEGCHFQSAFSGPYIYNAHCEYSNGCSCLFGLISGGCPSFDIEMGTKHLTLFNVKHFFVSSDKVKNILKENPNFERIYGPATFEIWELKTHEGKYVVLPEYQPILIETNKWRELSYQWFRNKEMLDVPIVFVRNIKEISERDFKRFATILYEPETLELPKIKIDKNCTIEEEIKTEEINIKTDCIGKPLWIKISFFPNWKVEGADKIYLVSPSFMMIFPNKENVKIYYGATISDIIGLFFSYLGLLIVIISLSPLKYKKIFSE
ncbi:MAG: 6-pyruvoyl-tetrahydropterin synthase-related protein [Candidatus Aenigmatarchaeota archaeon]